MKIDFRYGDAFHGPDPVVSGQQEAGHEGVVTRCDDFSLRSSAAIPVGVGPALQLILKASSSYNGCTLIFLKSLLMSQPLFRYAIVFRETFFIPGYRPYRELVPDGSM